MTTLTLKIPEDLAAELKSEARLRSVSKSEVAREALYKYIGRKKNKQGTSCYDLAKSFAGCVENAPVDLSTNPGHLKGFGR
jgi:predicted transcriptional regulator